MRHLSKTIRFVGAVALLAGLVPLMNSSPVSAAVVVCEGKSATVVGTAGPDVLTGTDGVDVIVGLGGNDRVHGLGGNDKICVGSANDLASGAQAVVDGGAGLDTISFRGLDADLQLQLSGRTVLTSNPGDRDTVPEYVVQTTGVENAVASNWDNVMRGDNGPNRLTADNATGGVIFYPAGGDDVMVGNNVDSKVSYADWTGGVKLDLATGISTGSGYDRISGVTNIIGSRFADELRGNDLPNVIESLDGKDYVNGKGGDDTILAGDRNTRVADAHTLKGGDGNDQIWGSPGNDLIDGGLGTDQYVPGYRSPAVRIQLAAGTSTGNGNDTLANIEGATGSLFDDVIYGNAGDNYLNGDSGDDVIQGWGGNDILDGFSGIDNFDGGSGADICYGTVGQDIFAKCETIG
jgi:Ca2+-binding RTX toxin-like protein